MLSITVNLEHTILQTLVPVSQYQSIMVLTSHTHTHRTQNVNKSARECITHNHHYLKPRAVQGEVGCNSVHVCTGGPHLKPNDAELANIT